MKIEKAKVKNYLANTWRSWRNFVLFVLLVFLPIRSSLADWNWVPSGSMNPTIMEGELLYINKLAYDLRFPLTLKRMGTWGNPESGDIIVFLSPDKGTRMVKRVIGCPGDTVEIRNNILFINDKALEYEAEPQTAIEDLHEQYAEHGEFYKEQMNDKERTIMHLPPLNNNPDFAKVTVPEGHYFVMGDNRDNSNDSRYFGFVKRDRVLGKATLVLASFDKLGYYAPRFSRFFKSLE